MTRPTSISDEEILRRARAIFTERGFEVGTKEIAAAVGLTWAAIALRFENKWGLFSAAMARPRFEPMDAGNAPVSAAGLFDLLARLHAYLHAWWPQSLRFCLATRTMDMHAETKNLLTTLTAALDRHARDGLLRSDIEVGVLARMVLLSMIGEATQGFVDEAAECPSDEDYLRAMVRLLTGAAAPVRRERHPAAV